MDTKELLKRITFDPAVMGGKPCLRGMRITVGTIVEMAANGHSEEKILASYPLLRRKTFAPRWPTPGSAERWKLPRLRRAARESSWHRFNGELAEPVHRIDVQIAFWHLPETRTHQRSYPLFRSKPAPTNGFGAMTLSDSGAPNFHNVPYPGTAGSVALVSGAALAASHCSSQRRARIQPAWATISAGPV